MYHKKYIICFCALKRFSRKTRAFSIGLGWILFLECIWLGCLADISLVNSTASVCSRLLLLDAIFRPRENRETGGTATIPPTAALECKSERRTGMTCPARAPTFRYHGAFSLKSVYLAIACLRQPSEQTNDNREQKQNDKAALNTEN